MLRAAQRGGRREAYKPLLDFPEIYPHLVPYWTAYQVLHRSRLQGFSGVQPCTITDVVSVCSIYGLDPLEFLPIVQELDDYFMSLQPKDS